MNTVRSIKSIKTSSRCFVPTTKNNRKFTALSNNPLFYSQVTYNKVVTDYHLQNPLVNNNGANESEHTQIEGEKLYINNSHLKKRRDETSTEKFEPVVYSPEDEVHHIGGTIIR